MPGLDGLVLFPLGVLAVVVRNQVCRVEVRDLSIGADEELGVDPSRQVFKVILFQSQEARNGYPGLFSDLFECRPVSLSPLLESFA